MTEEDTKRDRAAGHSTGSVFQVQVRSRDGQPGFAIGEMIIDQRWQDLHLAPSQWPVGVPTPRYSMVDIEYGVPFQVAEAQRWIFICLCEAMKGYAPVETRIVERRITRTWKCEDVGEVTKFPAWENYHNIWNASDRPLLPTEEKGP